MHKTLERQVKKFLAGRTVPDNLKGLLNEVDRTYEGYDRDRVLLEHSLEVSSKELNEINQKLREDAANFRKYLDIAGVMIVVIDRKQKVAIINRKGSEILGYDEKDIVGKNWFSNFLPKRLRKDLRKVFTTMVSSKNVQDSNYENFVLTRDRKERLISWHNTVLVDDKGRVTATLSSGDDVTDRRKNEDILKRANEELEKFNKLMIGRELKMVELKKEIERLKKK